MNLHILVTCGYDDKAGVWVATSEDLPLVTEAESLDVLHKKILCMIPELIEANTDIDAGSEDVPVELLMKGSVSLHQHC